MKRIRIVHKTEYHYNQPVTFGPQPRVCCGLAKGHDVHIARARASMSSRRHLCAGCATSTAISIAVLTFADPSQKLSILSEVDVDLYDDNPIECLIEPDRPILPVPVRARRSRWS